MSVIEVKNLTKDYGSGRGVFDVNISVNKGEVFGFLGPNGAGKSTTIRHLMGFSKPDSGETYILGKPTFEKYYEVLSKVGYIPGEIALPQGLTGWEFIRMMQSMQKTENKARLNELLEIFELADAELRGETKRMSLGVKRNLAVVTAFMSDPEVLILDEPTTGLDPMTRKTLWEVIYSLQKNTGMTVFLTTHYMEEAADADYVVILDGGRIAAEGTPLELKNAYTGDFITLYNVKEEQVKALALPYERVGGAFRITVGDTAAATITSTAR